MYQYDQHDQSLIEARSAEFRMQVERRLAGTLTEEEFKPLRLMNGLYLQLHAYMLRVAVPYGVLSSSQMMQLALIADKYDRGYGHFTTRQNIQFNWPQLVDTPDILDALCEVQMHAIQTSGNCIRNVTTDPFAGVAADESVDPRPLCELLRQWSTLMPEFSFLPRKFKFAVTGAKTDRAAIKFHDIGIVLSRSDAGEIQADIWVGGGQGRTPRIAQLLKSAVAIKDLLPYLDATLRVYNLYGNRDNKYKARIKILLASLGLEAFAAKVEKQYQSADRSRFDGVEAEFKRLQSAILNPEYKSPPADYIQPEDKQFQGWSKSNVYEHRQPGYAIAVISLKPVGGIPGDASSDQMRTMARLAEQFSASELRVTHRQNIVLPYVEKRNLHRLWSELKTAGLAADNIDQPSDIIACPGLDYCALAKARSIPVAKEIAVKIQPVEESNNLAGLNINVSGCINACGHHHVAGIGILGLEKNGAETYQVTLGGRNGMDASIGKVLGPGFSAAQVPGTIETLVKVWLQHRHAKESFPDTYDRVGKTVFAQAVYVAS